MLENSHTNSDPIFEFTLKQIENIDIDLEIVPKPHDGFSISSSNNRWKVVGNNSRSCLWGVRHVKRFKKEGSFCPRFEIRGINTCETIDRHTPEQITRLIDLMCDWQMNTLVIHKRYGYKRQKKLIHKLCEQRGISIIFYTQSSLEFLQGVTKNLFAKDNAGQSFTKELRGETRLCISNPDSLKIFREKTAKYFVDENSDHGITEILIDADGYLFCQCPECKPIAPKEQWGRLFKIAVEEAKKASRKIDLGYLAYVWRYKLPDDMSAFADVSKVMFDTHQRFRWQPIGQPHPLTQYNQLESQADKRAEATPINVYLEDRLREWRNAFNGNLFIFENLMLHGAISCPQPYTPQLLHDLDLYEEMKIDGVIYEAFGPGIDSYTKQLDTLSRAMWDKEFSYILTQLEKNCQLLGEDDCPDYQFKNCFNVLAYLTSDKFDGIKTLKDHINDPPLWEYAEKLKDFLFDRSWNNCRKVMAVLIKHKDRFDYLFNCFNLLKSVSLDQKPVGANELQKQILKIDKLCDLMEELPDPINQIEKELIELID